MAYSRHELGTINTLCSLKKLYHTTPLPKAKTIESRSVKNWDSNAFLLELKNIAWDSFYIYDNIDDIWSHWSGLF